RRDAGARRCRPRRARASLARHPHGDRAAPGSHAPGGRVMSAADTSEMIGREIVRGAVALAARSDALARLAQMMGSAVADLGPDATAEDVERRVGAVEAGVSRSVTILLESLTEAS